MKFDVKGWLKMGGLAGVISVALVWIFTKINFSVLNITMSTVDVNVRNQITSGISSKAGDYVLSQLSGLVNLTGYGILAVILSSLSIVGIGRFMYGIIPFKPNKKYQKLALIMLYGTILIGIVLGGISAFNFSLIGSILSLAIYFVIVSLAIIGLEKANVVDLPNDI